MTGAPESFGIHMNGTSFWYPSFMAGSAWLEHAPFAFWLTSVLKPRTIVELGTHGGFSYFVFCQAIKALELEARCYAVDTWKGDEHAGFYGEDVYSAVQEYNDTNYASFSRLIRSKFDDALPYFEDESIDLLHIDGRHFYDDVMHDFNSWKAKLSKRSVVIFHDTNVLERGFGVFKLWGELKGSYPSFEFLHGHGLGVLGYGADVPKEISSLFMAASDAAQTHSVRAAYGRLGASIKADVKNKLEKAKLNNAVNELEKKSHSLSVELEAHEEEKEGISRELDAERSRSAELADAFEARIDVLTKERNSLAEQLSFNISALQQGRAEIDDTLKELHDAKEALKEAEAQKRALQKELKATCEKNAGLHKARERYDLDTARAQKKILHLQNLLAQSVAEIDRTTPPGRAPEEITSVQIDAMKRLQARTDKAEARVQALLGSTSWRLTAPLRWLVHRFKGS